MQGPGDRSTRTQPEALDEFGFECEPEPAAPFARTGQLFEVRPTEPVLTPRPAALSRVESQAQRRKRRRRAHVARLAAYASAWRVRFARIGDLLTRQGSTAAAASKQAMRRTSLRVRERVRPAPPAPLTVTALEYQESNGFVVAVLLGMAVVGYGSFLVGSWRSSGVSVTRAAALTTGAVAPRPRPVVARPAMDAGNPLAGTPRVVAARAVRTTPNARTLTAMWQRRDTRSLDQAFNSLRQQTLAFHRCGMRVIDADRAVARCECVANAGTQTSRATAWTIDFQRTAGRWAIAHVATRPSTALRAR